MRACAAAVALGIVLLSVPSWADDPLDAVDGTDGWADIDTSALDRGEAWTKWRADHRRWQAGRARLSAERSRMARISPDGGDEEPPLADSPNDEQGHQARIERVRAEAEGGGATERDASGQSLDGERPWSRRK